MIHHVFSLRSGLVALVLVMAIGRALAFTPFVSTKTSLYYGSYGQVGTGGFFGPYDVDRGTTGNLAAANAWLGNGT